MNNRIVSLLLFLAFVVASSSTAVLAATAVDAGGRQTADDSSIAHLLRQQLATRSLDSASVASWQQAFRLLVEKGEILHARRVAWMLLYHPRSTGRTQGAMALMSTHDLADPVQATALLAIDNDCLRSTFLDLAEDGYFVKYPLGPSIARMLDDESYLANHRQLRVVRILRALYHYNDKSVVSRVARFLHDPRRKIREVAARTLGKLTGHAFSRKGDMDPLPRNYYVAKAQTWWFFNRQRPEFSHLGSAPVAHPAAEWPGMDAGEMLLAEIAKLQSEDFDAWSEAFARLLEYGLKRDASVLASLLHPEMALESDRVYAGTLLRLIDDYNRKRHSMSDRAFRTGYDIHAFCP